MKIHKILSPFFMLLITVSCSNNSADNTPAITIQLKYTKDPLDYIIKINAEEQSEHVDFNAMYPSSNAFIYENDHFTYEINVYQSETKIPLDFSGDLVVYMEEMVESVYHDFNKQNNTLIIEL